MNLAKTYGYWTFYWANYIAETQGFNASGSTNNACIDLSEIGPG
jgi:hypothetical protein